MKLLEIHVGIDYAGDEAPEIEKTVIAFPISDQAAAELEPQIEKVDLTDATPGDDEAQFRAQASVKVPGRLVFISRLLGIGDRIKAGAIVGLRIVDVPEVEPVETPAAEPATPPAAET